MSQSTGMGGASEAADITSAPPAPPAAEPDAEPDAEPGAGPGAGPGAQDVALEQQPEVQEAISDDTTAAGLATPDAGPDEDTPVFQEPGGPPVERPANPSA